MSKRDYILFASLFLLSACTVHNVFKHAENVIIPVTSEPDQNMVSIINPYKIGVDSVMNESLCFSSIEMTKGKPESLLGNFVTDLCLNMYDTIADICIMNNGGLRSSLPFGNVTRGDIYKLMPFENELVVLELNAEEVYELSRYIISRGGEPFSGMDICSGQNNSIEIKFYNDDNLYGNTDSVSIYFPVYVEEVYLKVKERKDWSIRVLTSDYLANGGDKMKFFNNKEQYKVGIKLRDAIINYCTLQDTIGSKLDNRFIISE